MTHEEARLLIGGDPEDSSAELQAHLKTCAECQAYQQQILALNAKLRRALELDWRKLEKAAPPPATAVPASTVASAAQAPNGTPPSTAPDPTPAAPQAAPSTDGSNVTILPRRPPPTVPKHKHPRLMAFAASIAAGLVAALVLWLSRPPESLAAEIVKHVEGEPNSWSETQPVSSDHLRAVLRKSGVKLGPGMLSVVYASPCWFRGHYVPHFVVTTSDGPLTVMILENETVSTPKHFNEDGYSGLLVPASRGSVAVVSRTPMPLEQPADTVVKALQAAIVQGNSTALPSRL
jgi:hypothetical protein